VLQSLQPTAAADLARAELAGEIVEDVCRLDLQLRELTKRLTAVVLASRTSVTKIFGVGPVIAATVVGITGVGVFHSPCKGCGLSGGAGLA
jgi:transposase